MPDDAELPGAAAAESPVRLARLNTMTSTANTRAKGIPESFISSP
jgi:hypothetical protein